MSLLLVVAVSKPVKSFTTMQRSVPFSSCTLSRLCRQGEAKSWRGKRLFAGGSSSNLDDLIGDLLDNPPSLVANKTTTTAAVGLDSTESNGRRSSQQKHHNTDTPEQVGWKTIDWQNEALWTSKSRTYDETTKKVSSSSPSPVDVTMILNRIVHIKRDDQLRLGGSQVSGNKARKMLALNSLGNHNDNGADNNNNYNFPRCVVSYGGPQSNAMLSLAAVVHFQNEKHGFLPTDDDRRRFVYFTKKLSRFLRKQPSGNLFRAQSLGMELVELSNNEYTHLFGGDAGGRLDPPPLLDPPDPVESLWIPQGGASGVALAGTKQLGDEIVEYWEKVGAGRPLSIVVPGGTCSTAALLHWALVSKAKQEQESDWSSSSQVASDIQVVVIPCVGDASYARRQMTSLLSQLGLPSDSLPHILSPAADESSLEDEYFSFGEPDYAILDTFKRMRDENNIVLDLLYGAPSWTILLRHLRPGPRSHMSALHNREIMYVHSGGLEGINSQLLRYKYKGLIDMEDIQLPGKSSDNKGKTVHLTEPNE